MTQHKSRKKKRLMTLVRGYYQSRQPNNLSSQFSKAYNPDYKKVGSKIKKQMQSFANHFQPIFN